APIAASRVVSKATCFTRAPSSVSRGRRRRACATSWWYTQTVKPAVTPHWATDNAKGVAPRTTSVSLRVGACLCSAAWMASSTKRAVTCPPGSCPSSLSHSSPWPSRSRTMGVLPGYGHAPRRAGVVGSADVEDDILPILPDPQRFATLDHVGQRHPLEGLLYRAHDVLPQRV